MGDDGVVPAAAAAAADDDDNDDDRAPVAGDIADVLPDADKSSANAFSSKPSKCLGFSNQSVCRWGEKRWSSSSLTQVFLGKNRLHW